MSLFDKTQGTESLFDATQQGEASVFDETQNAVEAPVEGTSLLTKLGQSASAAIPAVKAAGAGLAQATLENAPPAATRELQLDPAQPGYGTPQTMLQEETKARAERLAAEAQALRPDTSEMNPFMAGVANAPESVALSVAALPLTVATKSVVPIATVFGAQQAGSSYTEARKEGKTPGEALAHGGVQGALEGGFEAIPLFGLTKDLTAKTGLVQVVKNFLAKEVLTEEATTITQKLSDWAQLHPDEPASKFFSELPADMVQTLGGVVAGAGMQSAAIGGTAKAIEKISVASEKKRATMREAQDLVTTQSMEELTRLATEEAALSAGIMPNYPNQYDDPHDDITEPTPEDYAIAEQAKQKGGIPNDPAAMADAGDELTAMNRSAGFKQQELPLDVNPLTGESVLARRSNTELNTVPAGDRTIVASSLAEDIGFTSNQKVQAPGTTRGIGGNEVDYSPAYMKAVVDTVHSWAQKVLPPDARVVVNFNALADNNVGAYQQLKSGIHVITPREITRAEQGRGGTAGEIKGELQNFNTQAASIAAGGIAHEFGHALVMAQFAQQMPPQYRNIVSQMNDPKAFFTEGQLAVMPELERAVIQDFQARKIAILSNKMSAKELVDTWMGTWKVGFDVMKKGGDRSKYGFAEKALNAVKDAQGYGKTLESSTALDLIHALSDTPEQGEAYFLQFEEFMAEQMSRYVHARDMYKGTPLGQYFKQALEALKKFFVMLKKEGVVKPGTAFEAWVDAIAKSRAEQFLEAQKPMAKAKKARKAKELEALNVKAKGKGKAVVKEKNPIVKAVLELADSPEQRREYRRRVTASFPPMAVRTSAEKKDAKEIIDLIESGQYLLADDRLAEVNARKVKFDLKGKGGNWAVGAEDSLAAILFSRLSAPHLATETTEERGAATPGTDKVWNWAKRSTRAYLLKFAGTPEDPLRNLTVYESAPDEDNETTKVTWEDLMNSMITKDMLERAPGKLEPEYDIADQYSRVVSARLLQDKLSHVADNLANIPLDKLTKMSFVDAVLKSEQIDAENEKRAQKAKAKSMTSMPVAMSWPEQNLVLVQLTKPGEFAQESDVMGHSVRGYEPTAALRASPGRSQDGQGDEGDSRYGLGGWQAILNDTANIYSLRDSQTGDSLATLEIENDEEARSVIQIKGKMNRPVDARGHAALTEFLDSEDWAVVEDLSNLNMVDLAGTEDYSDNSKIENAMLEGLRDQFVPKRFITFAQLQEAENAWYQGKIPVAIDALERSIKLGGIYNQPTYQRVLSILRELPPNPDVSRGGLRDSITAGLLAASDLDSSLRWDKTGPSDMEYQIHLLQDKYDILHEEARQMYEEGERVDSEMNTYNLGKTLLWDKTGVEQEKDDARKATQALRNIGTSVKESRWVAKALNAVSNAQHSVLQIQQLAHTESDAGLKLFNTYATQLTEMKNKLLSKGVTVIQDWEGLSQDGMKAFEAFSEKIFWEGRHVAEMEFVGGKQQFVVSQGLLDRMQKEGIDTSTEEGQRIVQLYLDYNNSFLHHIGVMESSAIAIVRDTYRMAPRSVTLVKAAEIRAAANLWRTTPFVARSHVGDFIVKVYAAQEGKKELVYKEHFESAVDADAAAKKLMQTYPPEDIQREDRNPASNFQLSLPTEFLEVLRDSSEFTEEQLNTIAGATLKQSTDKLFSRVALNATRVLGTKQDMLANYANFIEDNANFTAKYVHGIKMTRAIAFTRGEVLTLQKAGQFDAARRVQNIVNTMQTAKDNIMHPKAEWHQARSVIALTMLLYAPKTALMNLTGLVQTQVALATEFGDIEGGKLFAKGLKEAVAGKVDGEAENWMLGEAINDGVIDQGYSYFMAGAANAGNLARRMKKTAVGKAGRAFLDGGMWAFKTVEVVNRKTTLLAFFRAELARELAANNVAKGDTVSEEFRAARVNAYATARERTTQLQNDYTAGNRPSVFHGRRSLFMIFLSYPQYMLWIMSGGYERGIRLKAKARGETPRSVWSGHTMRMWLIFAALSGFEGVPFGETLKELTQWLWKKFGKGENVNEEAQKFMKESLGIESAYLRQVMQKGLLYDVGGVNLSGSYSLGSPLPGTRLLNAPARNSNEFLGSLLKEFSGPFGGVAGGLAGLGTSPDVGLKELARNTPGEMGALARAADAARTGLTDNSGARVLRDDTGEVRDASKWEIYALALGFSLTEVQQMRTEKAIIRDRAMYYSGRRMELKKHFFQAKQDGDLQELDDLWKAVEEYNAEVPDGQLRLTGKELGAYVKERRQSIRKAESDLVPLRQKGLQRRVEEAYQ